MGQKGLCGGVEKRGKTGRNAGKVTSRRGKRGKTMGKATPYEPPSPMPELRPRGCGYCDQCDWPEAEPAGCPYPCRAFVTLTRRLQEANPDHQPHAFPYKREAR